jgi:hypothetical protein
MARPPLPQDPDHPFGQGLFGPLLLALGLSLLGHLGIRILKAAPGTSTALKVALALGTALPLAWAALRFHRRMRAGLDEMLRRILLEGMAFAFMAYLPLAVLYLNLQAAGLLRFRVDPPELLLSPALLLGWGIARAWRRYR